MAEIWLRLLATNGRKLSSKTGGAISRNDFKEGFACSDIKAREKSYCRYGLNG